jgi:hypothetical protein
LKKWILYAISVWGGLLLLGGMCAGVGALQLRSAANTIRNDNLSTNDVQTFSREIAVSNALLKSARYNPGVQILRVVPGVSWAPKALSAGSRAVSEVRSLLENGGAEIANLAVSGELTPEPGVIDVDAAVLVAKNAQLIADQLINLRSAVVELGELHIPGVDVSRIDKAVNKATDYLDVANSAVAAMKQMPQLIGSETPVQYFVGITNEAELRGIQGIIGEYAIVEFDRGTISVSRTGSNTDLVNPETLPPELIGDYSQTYGETNTEWQNVNLSPFLDPAALQITNAWKLQTGESLDGVILLDTVALAKWAIPKVGAVQSAQGRVLETWEALADYLSNGVYFEFPVDQIARKQFQSALAEKLIGAVTSSSLEPQQLLRSLAKPMINGRVVVWLNNELGSEFNRTFLARSSESFPTEVVVGFNNWTANKMDFYLKAMTSSQVECMGSRAWHTVNVLLENSAKNAEGYPEYLTRRLDISDGNPRMPGSYLDISIVLPAGSADFEVSLDDFDAPFDVHESEGGRTTVRLQSEVNAGEVSNISVRFRSDGRCDAYRVRTSPLRYGGE